jgi:hypothetical protein
LPRRRPFAEPLVALAFVALVSAGAERGARAAPTEAEITQARERFSAARKLEDAGRWAEALGLLQRVAEVKMTPQVRFHVALCLENVGLWTQALDGYAQAAGEAGASAADVLKEANEHLHKLEQVIPTVSLSTDGAAPGDELLLDRRRLPLDDLPLPIRADPGPHTAEVRRGGAVLARENFALDPGSTRRVELHIGTVAPEAGQPDAPARALSQQAGPAPPDPSAQPAAPGHEVAPPAGAAEARGGLQRSFGWTGVGVGAASAVLTGVFIGQRAGAISRLEQSCPALVQCPTSIAPTVGDGKTDAALVNVFGVLGGVAAAVGVVLLITAPVSTAPRPSSVASLTLGGDGRLTLRGRF